MTLGQPYDDMIDAYSGACYGASKIHIIRDAVQFFINASLAREPFLRRRYETAKANIERARSGGLRVIK